MLPIDSFNYAFSYLHSKCCFFSGVRIIFCVVFVCAVLREAHDNRQPFIQCVSLSQVVWHAFGIKQMSHRTERTRCTNKSNILNRSTHTQWILVLLLLFLLCCPILSHPSTLCVQSAALCLRIRLSIFPIENVLTTLSIIKASK